MAGPGTLALRIGLDAGRPVADGGLGGPENLAASYAGVMGSFSLAGGVPEITIGGGGWAGIDVTPLVADLSGSSFRIRMRSNDWAARIDGYCIVTTATGSLIWQFSVAMPDLVGSVQGTDDEWIEVAFTQSDFTVNSGTPDWSTVSKFRWQVYGSDGMRLALDGFVHAPKPITGNVFLMFDDGFASNHQEALGLLWENDIQATQFVIPEAIGTPGYMSAAQISDWDAAGMETGGHGATNLGSLSAMDGAAQIGAAAAALDAEAWRGRALYAFPNGFYNAAMVAAAEANGFSHLVSGKSARMTAVLAPAVWQRRQLGHVLSDAAIDSWIDAAALNGDNLGLAVHRITATPSVPEDITPAQFAHLVDYLAETRALGTLTLKSLGELHGAPHSVPALPAVPSVVGHGDSGNAFSATRSVTNLSNGGLAGDFAYAFVNGEYPVSAAPAPFSLLAEWVQSTRRLQVFGGELTAPLGTSNWSFAGAHNQSLSIVIVRGADRLARADEIVFQADSNKAEILIAANAYRPGTLGLVAGYRSGVEADFSHGTKLRERVAANHAYEVRSMAYAAHQKDTIGWSTGLSDGASSGLTLAAFVPVFGAAGSG